MTDSGREAAPDAARAAEQGHAHSPPHPPPQLRQQPATPAAAAGDDRHEDGDDDDDDDEIRPYRIHVSSKYLELTRRKLELTRLPHDVAEPKSTDGWWEPKPHVEPLIDFWLEHFSWRRQEARLNDALPQYRASLAVPGTPVRARLHFVHAPSARPGAVPLLLLPPFPFTGLSLGHLVPPLTDPPSDRDDDDDSPKGEPFHVVVPSLPGLGFSDALPGDADAVPATAAMLDALMRRLGYARYLVSNAGSAADAAPAAAAIDWQIVTRLATRHADSCAGAHLVDPPLAAPALRDAPLEWARLSIARLLGSPLFGYTADDLAALARSAPPPPPPPPSRRGATALGPLEPNTLAFALCDSPVGLLALLLRTLRALGQRRHFAPEELVTMAMLAWLPGPEAALRYWAHCAAAAAARSEESRDPAPARRPKVAVTVFLGASDVAAAAAEDDVEMASLPAPVPHRYACPRWAGRRFDLVHAARVPGEPGLLAWERPGVVVEGVAALARRLVTTDPRLRPAAEGEVEGGRTTVPLRGVVTDDGTAKEPAGAPAAGRDALRPPPMMQHASSETRVGDGDVASPKTLGSSPGTSPQPGTSPSPSPQPVKGE